MCTHEPRNPICWYEMWHFVKNHYRYGFSCLDWKTSCIDCPIVISAQDIDVIVQAIHKVLPAESDIDCV